MSALPFRSPLGMAASLVLAVLLTGCSSGDEQPQPDSAPETSSATPAPDRTTVDDQGGVGAHQDLQKPQCTADPSGAWSFSGTVANSTKERATYTVEVSVVNPDGWGVLGATTVTAQVDPGESAPVAAEKFHADPPDQTRKHQCVTRVVRHAE